jgi:predicted DNA-binding transcriptional regulator YafY
MAVTKIPRKKPVTTAAPEAEEPAPKGKATPARKAAPKKAAPKKAASTGSGTKASTKAPARAKAPKAAELATVEEAVLEVNIPEATAPETSVPEPLPVAKAAAGTPVLTPHAQTILTAICEGRAVEFIFADADANAPRTFEPRHLTFDGLSQAWFAWGWDRRYNAERHHRVDLLAEVNPVEGVGRAAQGPYAEGTPANQIGGWLGGEPIAVKATLQKQWVFAVKQAPPAFPNFRLEESGDGQALVSFTATDLRAIARWCMQFGDGIQVLEPARLVDRIRQVGTVWAGRDRQAAAPAPAPKPAQRPEPAPEPRRQEARPPRETRPEREPRHEREREREDSAKGKPGKVEVIRFDRI